MSREQTNALLMAVGVALVLCGFVLTQSLDQPQVGGVVLFAGVTAGILVVAARPGPAPLVPDRGFAIALFVLTLVAAPAVLLVIEIFHPHGFSADVYNYLVHTHTLYFGPVWWTALHAVQTPMVGAVGGGLFLATRGMRGPLVWLTRIATLVFVIYYTALDTLGGVGVGVLIDHTRHWTGPARQTAAQLVQFLFTNTAVGGTGSVLSETASWAALLAFSGVALCLARAGGPLLASFLLAAGGILIEIAHTRPYGPVGFTCVLLAGAAITRWRAQLGSIPAKTSASQPLVSPTGT
jgi:hypothetical protein